MRPLLRQVLNQCVEILSNHTETTSFMCTALRGYDRVQWPDIFECSALQMQYGLLRLQALKKVGRNEEQYAVNKFQGFFSYNVDVTKTTWVEIWQNMTYIARWYIDWRVARKVDINKRGENLTGIRGSRDIPHHPTEKLVRVLFIFEKVKWDEWLAPSWFCWTMIRFLHREAAK